MTKNDGKYPLRFFIVGSQRTGTTLIRLILESHPKVFCYDEGSSYGLLRDKVFGLPPVIRKDPTVVERIGYKIPRWTEQLGQPQIVDNFEHEGATAFYLGEPLVFLHRDVRDTVASMITLKADGCSWVRRWGRRIIEDKIAHDRQFKDKFRKEIDLVTSLQWSDAATGALCWKYNTAAYWDYCSRGFPTLGLRYEDLVRNPEQELRRAAAFLQIEWDEALLQHNKHEHEECPDGSAIGGTDPTAAISLRSLNRYRQVLSDQQLDEIEQVAGELNARVGAEDFAAADNFGCTCPSYQQASLALEAAAGHFRGETEHLQELLQERTNWALKAENDIRIRDEEVARLQKLLQEVSEWAQKATNDIKIRDTELAELQGLVEERTKWALAAVHDVEIRDTEIRRLQQVLEDLQETVKKGAQ